MLWPSRVQHVSRRSHHFQVATVEGRAAHARPRPDVPRTHTSQPISATAWLPLRSRLTSLMTGFLVVLGVESLS